MPRGKNKSGRPKGPPPHVAALIESRRRGKGQPKDGLLQQILAERSGSSPAIRAHGYTLAEEAKNTAFNRRGKLGADAKLRYRPMVFVSAGVMDPLKDPDYNQKPPSNPQPDAVSQDPPVNNEAGSYMDKAPPMPIIDNSIPLEASVPTPPVQDREDSPAPQFLIDVDGDSSLRPGFKSVTHTDNEVVPSAQKLATVQQHSKDSDSSDDEIILFRGRDGHSKASASAPVAVEIPVRTLKEVNPEGRKLKEDSMELGAISQELKVVEKSIDSETVHENGDGDKTSLQRDTYTRTDVEKKPTKQPQSQDHISITPSNSRKQRAPRKPRRDETSSEEAAIIADYIANTRDSDDDGMGGDADGRDVQTHAFHSLRDIGGTDSDAIPDGASSEANSDDSSSQDSEDDDAALRQDRVAEDERIARLLAKQEQLGLSSADVILLDSEDPEAGGGDEWELAAKGSPRRRKKGSSKAAKLARHKNIYPSATQFAEAFDDLDLMDWQRPSLNNFNFNSKKKRGPVFDISDSELEEAMNETWKKDRLKKADKKKAREELRSQGLLGKNVNPDDLRVKYNGGMSIDDLANELEAFLTGDQEQLSLPPFDKRSRMTVHEIANKLKLKSQSAGKGNNRYTVLFRTRRTLKYEQVSFDRTLSRVRQVWFPRVDVDDEVAKQAKIFRNPEPRTKGRGQSSLTYREGDIVGHDAAELGTENKGRAMLEKMGWSKGMSLGSEENKGIVVPLTHVMKKSKLGLGEI